VKGKVTGLHGTLNVLPGVVNVMLMVKSQRTRLRSMI